MFKNLVRQLQAQNNEKKPSFMSSPLDNFKDKTQKAFLKTLSEHALKLYERKTDIKNFTKLALSNPENKDYVPLVDKIFKGKDVIETLSDEELYDLSVNEKLLRDLGL